MCHVHVHVRVQLWLQLQIEQQPLAKWWMCCCCCCRCWWNMKPDKDRISDRGRQRGSQRGRETECELIGKLSWGSSSGGSTKLSGTVNCGKMSLNLKLPLTDLPTTWLAATWAPPCCATVCATYACCRFHWNVRIAANGDALMAVHQIEIETKIKRKIHLKCSSTQLRTSFLPLPHPMGGVASLFIAPFIHYHSNRSQRTVSAKNKKPLNSPLHGASASARADGMHAEKKIKK